MGKEVCSICNGWGYEEQPWALNEYKTDIRKVPCSECNGSGYVWVDECNNEEE